jgi:hypothetical protein
MYPRVLELKKKPKLNILAAPKHRGDGNWGVKTTDKEYDLHTK